MKRLLFALALATAASTLSAQTASTSNVPPITFAPTAAGMEYRARVATANLPTFVITKTPGKDTTHVHLGWIEATSGKTQVRFAYLPILAPLPGSVPTTTSVMPDAFALNHVELPWPRRLLRERFATNR